MKHQNTPIESRIFVEGFIAGLITGIGFKTGLSPDEGSVSLLLMESVCKATEGMTSHFNCWGFLALVSFVVLLITIASILQEITRVDDWRIGLVIYGIGFIAGLTIVFLVIK